jgi:hypothetical protein
MTMGMKALTTAFLKWQQQQLQLEALGKQTTWQMYRRKLKVLNRYKLIVFVGQHCGIFPSHGVFMLDGINQEVSQCWPGRRYVRTLMSLPHEPG